MPLVRIDVVKGQRSPEALRKLADVVQQVLLDHFDAPPRDKYQIITQHEPYELICEDTHLGYQRTKDLVIIQILQQGRDSRTKQKTYASLAEELKVQCGLRGEDLIITCAENTRDDWSFGRGEAQFLTGRL